MSSDNNTDPVDSENKNEETILGIPAQIRDKFEEAKERNAERQRRAEARLRAPIPRNDQLASPASTKPDTDSLVNPGDGRIDYRRTLETPLTHRPIVRAGVYSWALVGLVLVAIGLGFAIKTLSMVVVPLVLALFPATVMKPAVENLERRGWPDWAGALTVLLGSIAVIGGIIAIIAPMFVTQLDNLQESLVLGYDRVDNVLRGGFLGFDSIRLDELLDRIRDQAQEFENANLAGGALNIAKAFVNTLTGTVLMLFATFFYLKDGRKIADWFISIFPSTVHKDVEIIGVMGWRTIGGYIQGQVLVGFADAVFIGIGLALLQVELAVPLAVIVFLGGLFPIVGATVSGGLAALVALATNGLTTALLVIVIVLAVQNIEGQLLQPFILGRAVSLHPLAIIVSLAVGGFLMGILGAFIAVPVAAASAQTIGYLRERLPSSLSTPEEPAEAS